MKRLDIYCFLIFFFIGTIVKAQTTQVKNSVTMTNLIDNNGDKLFTTIYPNICKETIILLHGGPGFPSDLTFVAEALAKQFQVITFHQRGTKQSPCKSRASSLPAYGSELEAVAKHYNLKSFHLFGHSWGGLYAQIYAEQHPEKLLSLFLCNPGSGTNKEWKQTEKEVMQFNKAKCTSGEWMKMGLNNLLGMMGSSNAYKKLFKQVMKNYNDGFVSTSSVAIDFDNLKADPINITRKEIAKVPLLKVNGNPKFKISIVYGEKDIYKTSKFFVLNRYPTANVTTIKNCGHLPWLHNPTEFKRVLEKHYK